MRQCYEPGPGFVVMRYCCKLKEQRRIRLFEKALDACATSPFARTVRRWILAGVFPVYNLVQLCCILRITSLQAVSWWQQGQMSLWPACWVTCLHCGFGQNVHIFHK